MKRLEVSGTVRPTYGSLGVKRLKNAMAEHVYQASLSLYLLQWHYASSHYAFFLRRSTFQMHRIGTKGRNKVSLYCCFPHFVFFQSPFCPPVFASCPYLVCSFYGISRCLTTLVLTTWISTRRQFYESFIYSCSLSLFLSRFLFP